MRYPYCGTVEDRVVDSREVSEASQVRRRRDCEGCLHRFEDVDKFRDELHRLKRAGEATS
jgi:transcriptional repressor NrdR